MLTDICSFLFSCELFDNLLETWDNPILPAYLPATSNFTLFNIGEKSDLGLESVSAVLSHGLAWVSAEVVIHGSQDWPSPHCHETEGRIWWIVSTELYWCSLPETHRLWEVLQGSEAVETLHAPSVKEGCTMHSAIMCSGQWCAVHCDVHCCAVHSAVAHCVVQSTVHSAVHCA